jgi:pimeloyl-ACP methyl ester carboxylesterase
MNKEKLLSLGKCSYFDSCNNKPPLILIHGFSLKIGYEQYIKLLEKKFRIILPDLPFANHNKFLKKHTVQNYVEFIDELIEKLKLKNINIFGNSLGGALALSCVLKNPNKFNKIIVRSPFYSKKLLPMKYKNSILLSIYKTLTSNPFFLNIFTNRFYDQMGKLSMNYNTNTELYEKIKSAQKKLDNPRCREFIFSLLDLNLIPHLSKINNPTYILWPDKDSLLTVNGANYLHNNIKNSKLFIEQNSYHCIATVKPHFIVNKITSFIEK